LGSNLLRCVERYAEKENVEEIELLVTKDNKDAVEFYFNRDFYIERFVMRKKVGIK